MPRSRATGAPSTECEEVFFIRAETVLGPWDCVSCPADVVHGFENVGLRARTS